MLVPITSLNLPFNPALSMHDFYITPFTGSEIEICPNPLSTCRAGMWSIPGSILREW